MDPASLERHGALGRFAAPVEAEYRRWLSLHVLPLATAVGVTSVISWFIGPPLAHLTVADSVDLSTIYLVAWAINIPVLSVGLAVIRSKAGSGINFYGALAICVTATDSAYLIGPAIDAGAMAYVALILFYSSFAPVIELPFRHTALVAVYVSATGVWAWALQEDATWNVEQAVLILTALISALLIGPAVSWSSERGLRDAYAAERTIEHQRGLIRRYAPSSVVSRIELGDTTVDAPQRLRITAFSSDVVGFTAMADRIDPEALAHIINDYLGAVSDLIERHGGTVTEFAGDGVMAIFGAPEETDPVDQVRSAVAAARELQASLTEWSSTWYAHGIIEAARARIGINTGVVSVGTFGSSLRATYTGIGLQMNIAARVQAHAEPGGILLSNTSWHLVKDEIACEPRGEVMVKGVHFPIELYEPVR